MSFSICSACTLRRYGQISISKLLRPHKRTFRYPLIFFKKNVHTEPGTAWIEPQGHETGISLYNTFSKTKVPFKTLNPGFVSWYNCGPTVYDSAHIGHALCYVKLDIIRRIMENIFKLNVVQVTGVTDIDDKIIIRAKESGTTVHSLTRKYEKEFFEDMDKLNVLPYSITPRVTEFIPQIVAFVNKIMENGFAYDVGEGNIYFDTSSFGLYGKLVKPYDNDLMQIISDPRKKSIRDFALWKGSKDSDIISWDSPWGPGRPGWHIECSVMACQIFGERLDLHSGGVDLIFPHHENEEAQCCAHHSSNQWCNYWIHTGHLHIKGPTKMSKSLHNTISVESFLQDHSSNVFRLFCLFSHYRSTVEYTSESMRGANANLKKFKAFFQDSQAYIDGNSFSAPLDDPLILEKFFEVQNTIRSSLADDFNTRQAMHSLLDLISLCNKELAKSRRAVRVGRSIGTISAVRGYTQNLLTTLGLRFQHRLPIESDSVVESKRLVQIVDSALDLRRTVKNIALQKHKGKEETDLETERKRMKTSLLNACDKMREEFATAGVKLTDYPGKTSWSFQNDKAGAVDASATETENTKPQGDR